MTRQHVVYSVGSDEPQIIPLTPEEEAAADAAELALTPPVGAPLLYAVAELIIADGIIDGIPLNSRLSAALWLDVGLYYVFFAESLPDASYLAKAYDGANADVRVIEKTTDYIVVQAWDSNGDPTDPATVSIEIIRVG
jgi:hypothetical protein